MAVTKTEFAGLAAGLARDAASWAVAACGLPERASDPVPPTAIAGLAAEVRDRLAILEQWAAEAPAPALNREEASHG
ncbi:hypothetical protein [Methylorubrum extorquens]|uniref:hypothetical protein n=1 Tax=Methylorubrum extorquens TaxID=408 RepID=UPI0011BEA4AF|nr:hypothetical protein [Methylorubrum extorquens]